MSDFQVWHFFCYIVYVFPPFMGYKIKYKQ